MPRSKNPDKYPSVFKELLLAAFAAKDKGITWKCPDLPTATRTKMQLYAYMNAVTKQEDANDIPDELRDSKRFHQVQITTTAAADGATVKLMNKNFTPEAIAIQEALSGFGRLVVDTDDDKEAQAKAQAIIDAFEKSGVFNSPNKVEFAIPGDLSENKRTSTESDQEAGQEPEHPPAYPSNKP